MGDTDACEALSAKDTVSHHVTTEAHLWPDRTRFQLSR